MSRNILYGGLVGIVVEVVDASNPSLIGIKGRVVNETKKMLYLDDGRKLIKSQVVLAAGGKRVDVNRRVRDGRKDKEEGK